LQMEGVSEGVQVKTVSETFNYLADVVGEESQRGKTMQAGILLDVIDSLAGRIAIQYSHGPVVTLSFDRVDLLNSILHLDFVRLEGRLIHIGKSSMVIEVKGFRNTITTDSFKQVCLCYVTMVAVNEDGRPRSGLPLLKHESEEEKQMNEEVLRRKELSKKWSEIQENVDKMTNLKAEEVEDPLNKQKKFYIPIRDTELKVKRQFLPRHLNHHNTIFGGEILLWMDRISTYTARKFTGNPNMVTISMNRLFFKLPIKANDIVEMTSRVVYVRNFVLEVEINVGLERNGQTFHSHSGYFTILNADEMGNKQRIKIGLTLEDSDQDGLRSYLKAKERFHFWRTNEITNLTASK